MSSAPPKGSPWWHRDVHTDRRPFLAARGRIVNAVRSHFEAAGFSEVDTAILQTSPGNEAHLSAFGTEIAAEDGARAPLYLHTSPEFACKKLLAAGEQRIFTYAKVFRNGERSALHHPEFTMLEWYRAGERYEVLMDDCRDLLRLAATAAGSELLAWRGRAADPLAEPERLTVAEAFGRYAGIDLLGTLPEDPAPHCGEWHQSRSPLVAEDRGGGERAHEPAGGTCPHPRPLPERGRGEGALRRQAEAAGIRTAADDTWSDIFSRVMVDRIEPNLGIGRATVLYEYPAIEAALARRKPGDPRVAERFELYACGVELANAFGELTDPVEQRARLEAEMTEKERVYGERYPIDEDFLAALAVMPEASGTALGLDRLVMMATGASRIEQVLWTPVVDPWS